MTSSDRRTWDGQAVQRRDVTSFDIPWRDGLAGGTTDARGRDDRRSLGWSNTKIP